jgi:hypothetical protein
VVKLAMAIETACRASSDLFGAMTRWSIGGVRIEMGCCRGMMLTSLDVRGRHRIADGRRDGDRGNRAGYLFCASPLPRRPSIALSRSVRPDIRFSPCDNGGRSITVRIV